MFTSRRAVPRAPLGPNGLPVPFQDEATTPVQEVVAALAHVPEEMPSSRPDRDEQTYHPCGTPEEEQLRQTQLAGLLFLPDAHLVNVRVLGTDGPTVAMPVSVLREILADDGLVTSDDVTALLLCPELEAGLQAEIDTIRWCYPDMSDDEYNAHITSRPTCCYNGHTNTLWVPPIYYPR